MSAVAVFLRAACVIALGFGPLLSAAGRPARAWKHDRNAVLVKVDEFRLATARQGAAAVALGDHIYVFGGSNWDHSCNTIERIDPARRSSERLKPRILTRAFHAALPYEGRIYLFGGQATSGDYEVVSTPRIPGQRMANENFEPIMETRLRTLSLPRLEPSVEVFDPSNGVVSVLGSMPAPRTGMAAAVLGSSAYFVGGTEMSPTGVIQVGRHDVFDFVSREWSTALEMLNPRECPAVAVDRLMLVAGGRFRDKGLRAVEVFDPADRAWKFLPPLPRAVAGHSLVRLGHHLFLFGGYDTPKRILAYDLVSRSTTEFQASLSPATHSAAVVHGDRIYVIGGKPGSEENETDLIQVFALANAQPAN